MVPIAFNNVISRSVAQALIPEVVSNDILERTTQQSAALSLFRKVGMSTNQTRMPVLAALPTAYFVNGDTGMKQTTEIDWTNKYLNVEEIACIVPLPDAVLEDVKYDLWGEAQPLVAEAIGRTLDAAVFFSVGKPSSWPTAIVPGAAAASNTVNRGTNATAAGGIAGDFSDAFGLVEADGFDVNGVIATRLYRGRLRNARATTGESLVDINGQVSVNEVYGTSVTYPMRGLWPATASGVAEAVVGDFSNGILGIRRDITFKMFDQGVVQDNTGAIVYNFMQQDMQGLRVTFRVAWQVANIINYDNQNAATRYPFATILAP